MAEIQWIKLSTDIFSNRKIRQLERSTDGAQITLIWIKLLCLAGLVNDCGQVYIAEDIPYTAQLLAAEVGCKDAVAERALELFERFDMAKTNESGHIYICDWERHQNTDALDKIHKKHCEAQARYYRRQKEKSALTSALTSADAPKEKEKDKENNKENNKSRCTANAPAGESPSSSAEPHDESAAEVNYTLDFEKFWKSYPVRTAKRKCFEIWQIKKLGEKAEQIIDAVEKQKKSAAWKKENGRYIPNPQTYLTGDRWEDVQLCPELDPQTAWFRNSSVYRHLTEG